MNLNLTGVEGHGSWRRVGRAKKSKGKKSKQPKTGFTGDNPGFYSIKPDLFIFISFNQ
jgi:hypothetical protein